MNLSIGQAKEMQAQILVFKYYIKLRINRFEKLIMFIT